MKELVFGKQINVELGIVLIYRMEKPQNYVKTILVIVFLMGKFVLQNLFVHLTQHRQHAIQVEQMEYVYLQLQPLL